MNKLLCERIRQLEAEWEATAGCWCTYASHRSLHRQAKLGALIRKKCMANCFFEGAASIVLPAEVREAFSFDWKRLMCCLFTGMWIKWKGWRQGFQQARQRRFSAGLLSTKQDVLFEPEELQKCQRDLISQKQYLPAKGKLVKGQYPLSPITAITTSLLPLALCWDSYSE